jgi:hypothetical protein
MWNVGQGKLADLPEIRCGIGIWSAGAESGEGGLASPGVSGRATRQEGTVLKRRPENGLSAIKVDESHHKRVWVGTEKTLRKSDREMTSAAISFGLE